MTTSHNKYKDIPPVDNEFAKPFANSCFQSPLLAGVPTGVNKPNATGTPNLKNWPYPHDVGELPPMAGGGSKKRKK